jgi:hypothetical protein
VGRYGVQVSARRAAIVPTLLSEINSDGNVVAPQFGNSNCLCHQLRERRAFRYSLLNLAIDFPAIVARGNQPLSGGKKKRRRFDT